MIDQAQSVGVEVGARLAERFEFGIQRREVRGRLRVVFALVRAAVVPVEDGFGVPDERLPHAAVGDYRLRGHTFPADVENVLAGLAAYRGRGTPPGDPGRPGPPGRRRTRACPYNAPAPK